MLLHIRVGFFTLMDVSLPWWWFYRVSVLAITQGAVPLVSYPQFWLFLPVQDLCECLAEAFCFLLTKDEPYRFPHYELWELSILLSRVEELWADNEGLQAFSLLAGRMGKHSN